MKTSSQFYQIKLTIQPATRSSVRKELSVNLQPNKTEQTENIVSRKKIYY